jgi:RNA polymerase sigma-70 factor (ECF subfamily)
MPKLSDRELVEAALQGHCQAFDLLVKRHYDAIFNVAFKMVRDCDDAKDVLQTVFIRAYQKLETFQPDQEFFRWIHKIAVNESINLLKKGKRRAELWHDLVSLEKSPEERYQETELADRVQNAMMHMTTASRALIVLRYFADLTYRELSYVFEAPEKTIKSRLYEARRSLSMILTRRGAVART